MTAVEWLLEKWAIQGTLHSSDIAQALEMEREQGKYSMSDLRNAYRWGATVDSATSEHFSEFVETLKTK